MATTNDALTGDPIVSFNFGLEVQGIIDGFFTSVSGLGGSSEVAEEKLIGPNGIQVVRKHPARFEGGEITLKRAISDNMDAWKWRKMVETGKVAEARSNGSVFLYDQEGNPVSQWDFTEGWPSKIEADSLDSGGSAVPQETITIVYETLTRVS
jgi:phage tail-like protein